MLKCVGVRQSWDFVIIHGKIVKNGQKWGIFAWPAGRTKPGTSVLQVFSGTSADYASFFGGEKWERQK